jgi:flap endonuclease GEN
MNKHLCWEPQYAFEKIFTLITRWQLVHLPGFTLGERLSISDLFIPDRIKKIRNIRSIASYEIIWKKEHSAMEMLKEYKELAKQSDSDDNDDNVDNDLLTSIEAQDMVLKCYPELVEAFEATRNVKTKKRTAASRKKKNIGETNIEAKDTAKSEENRQKQKKTRKVLQNKNNRRMDEFMSVNHPVSLEESFEKMAITPKRSKRQETPIQNELQINSATENIPFMDTKQMKRGPQFRRVLETEKIKSKLNNTIDRMFNELSPDDFMSENEDDDLNITDMIESICSKPNLQFGMINGQTIEFINGSENVIEEYTKIDKFSSSMEEQVQNKNEKEELSESDDEFAHVNNSYIPIDQRIQIGRNKKLLQTCCHIEKKSNFNFEDIMNETDNESIHLDT